MNQSYPMILIPITNIVHFIERRQQSVVVMQAVEKSMMVHLGSQKTRDHKCSLHQIAMTHVVKAMRTEYGEV